MNFETNGEEIIKKFQFFTENTTKIVNDIMDELHWNQNITEENLPSLVCPFNSNHRVPKTSLIHHLEDCQWKAEGYNKDDIPLSIPCAPPGTSTSSSTCIKFDEGLYKNIFHLAKLQYPSMNIVVSNESSSLVKAGVSNRLVPRSSDRLVADFTTDERKILYEYVIANTIQLDIGADITDLKKSQNENCDGKKTSYLELLAQERNLKRRRAKHRGVHTNKKSHLEVMREVINQQMEMLAEYISEKQTNTQLMEVENFNTYNDESLKRSMPEKKRDRSTYSSDHQKEYSEENHYRKKLKKDINYHDTERRERSRHSRKSPTDHDRHRNHHRKDSKHSKRHKSKDRHYSRHRDHDQHKNHKSTDRDRSKSSKISRHENSRSHKRRKSRD